MVAASGQLPAVRGAAVGRARWARRGVVLAALCGLNAVGARALPRPMQEPILQEAKFAYVGSRACRRCHLQQYRTWETSAHARAFDLLAPGAMPDSKRKVNLVPEIDYRDNAFCLGCHTVGFQAEGGFESFEATPALAGIGCENCHGPGGAYIDDDVMGKNNSDHSFDEVVAKGLVYPVPETTCRRCHGIDTPFNGDIFPEYKIAYSRETMAEEFTHTHRPLRRSHGPLPAGVVFQDAYQAGQGRRAPDNRR